VLQGIGEDPLFDLRRDPIGMRATRAAPLFNEGGDTTGLEGAADFIEGVAVIAHETAGLGQFWSSVASRSSERLRRVLCETAAIQLPPG
jgi:hypothetical protein